MKLTVDDAKNMLEKLSETFADKSVGDMWSMGFLTTMHVTNILDLLNSQKAEIERLNVELVGMRGACESYKMHYDNAQAELENKNVEIDILIRKKKTLRDEISGLSAEVDELKKTVAGKQKIIEEISEIITDTCEDCKVKLDANKVKSEAIREFVNKYKDHIKSFTGMFSSEMGFMVNLDAILFAVDFVADKLVKEMVGDEDA